MDKFDGNRPKLIVVEVEVGWDGLGPSIISDKDCSEAIIFLKFGASACFFCCFIACCC